MRRTHGFTLVEIMIVVAVMALLAAIAIPNLLRARAGGQEAAAAKALQTILGVEVQYRATNPTFGTLGELAATFPPSVDGALASGTKQGYVFAVSPNAGTDFFATAQPVDAGAAHTFYIDEDGVLCRSQAVNTPAPAAHVGNGCPVGFSPLQ